MNRFVTAQALLLLLLLSAPGAHAQITDNPAAASVLGQTDFVSRTSGVTASTLNGPNGVAVDPTTGKLFVADRTNHRVLRYASAAALQTGGAAEAVLGQDDFTTRVTGTAANRLNNPIGVHVDTAGRLWVADFSNNRVLRFDGASAKATGASADGVLGQATFTTGASVLSASGMRGPVTAYADGAGRVWVTEFTSHRVTRFDDAAQKPNGAAADGVSGQPDFTTGSSGLSASSLSSPNGSYVDAAGRLYVSDSGNRRVLRFDAATTASGTSADGVLGQPDFVTNTSNVTREGMTSLRFVFGDSVGRLYVLQEGSHRMTVYENAASRANGAPADYVIGQPDFTTGTAANPPSASSFNTPRAVYVDEARNSVWVADWSNNRVLRFDVGVAPASATVAKAVDDGPGFRLLSAPVQGVTVDALARVNLVQGIAGNASAPNEAQYPAAGPNLFTAYTPGASGPDVFGSYTRPARTDAVVEPGRGFFWFLYDQAISPPTTTSGGGTSQSYEIPARQLTATGTANTGDVTVTFAAPTSDGFYMVGNPFAQAMTADGVTRTDGTGGMLQNRLHLYDPTLNSYQIARRGATQRLSTWQGVFAEAPGGTSASFTFAAAARVGADTVLVSRAVPETMLALTLDGRTTSGTDLHDRAIAVTFGAEASAGWDADDASKLTPPTAEYALVALVGTRDGQPRRQAVLSLPADLGAAGAYPLAFTATTAGSYTLAAADVPDGWMAELRDTRTGAIADLAAGYAFSSDATDWADRFVLILRSAGATAGEAPAAGARTLSAPRPNPATGQSTLTLRLGAAEHVTATVVDALGRTVATLYDAEAPAATDVTLAVDASRLAPGVYVVRVHGASFADSRRLTVVR